MDQIAPLNLPVPAPQRMRGFTLIELLTVMGVMAVLLVVVVPAFTGIAQGTDLTRAGQDFADTLTLARDEAQARNRKVVIRLIQEAGLGTTVIRYRGVQAFAKDDAGSAVALGKIIQLPKAIVFAEAAALSPLLQVPPAQAGKMPVGTVMCDYVEFTINARGTLDTASGSANNNSFLTLVQERDVAATKAPKNFFSVYINPSTGEASTFRP